MAEKPRRSHDSLIVLRSTILLIKKAIGLEEVGTTTNKSNLTLENSGNLFLYSVWLRFARL